jgi:hypothetical protein
VEAAGIEPASRGISTGASTCVADALVFVPLGSYRRDSRGLIQERAAVLLKTFLAA